MFKLEKDFFLLIAIGVGLIIGYHYLTHPDATPTKPVGPPTPIKPSPTPPRLVVAVQANCEPCSRQKAELEGKTLPFPFTLQDITQSNPFKVRATPTLIKVDGNGKEIKRHEGYLSLAELIAWMEAS